MDSDFYFAQYEVEIIIGLANNIFVSPSANPDVFCKQARELSTLLPNRIKTILRDFVNSGSPNGFLLFPGFRCADNILPTTPVDNMHKIGEKTILSRIQAIFISFIGEMIAYQAEGYGRLFQDVIPVKSMASNQTSVGSNVELEIHTEQAFSTLRPDFLSLACLRGDKDAFTYILPVQYILDNLTCEEIELIQQPFWLTGVDLSFKLDGHEFIEGDVRGPMPILSSDCHGIPILIFDQDLMKGIDDKSNRMIKKIVDIYYKYRIEHNLKPGEIIIIDNRMALHGRSPFFPKYDGYDRFLIRCFATTNYKNSEDARTGGGRMVSAIYS